MIKKFKQFNEKLDYLETTKKSFIDKREEFINNLPPINELTIDMVDNIISWMGHEGHNYYDDAVEDLTDKIKEYRKFSDPVILYRVIAVKDSKHIDTNNMGEHYTPYEWAIDGDMLMSIGSDEWEDDWTPYILKVSVPISEIDTKQTLVQNLDFPNEHEINLKNKGKGAKLISVEKMED